MSLCSTCGGTGNLGVPPSADPNDRCPAGCVAVKAHKCQNPNHSGPCLTDYYPTLITQHQDLGFGCGSVTEFHDPATVLLWCETHGQRYMQHRGSCLRYYWPIALDSYGKQLCHIVVYPMPTVSLGVLNVGS